MIDLAKKGVADSTVRQLAAPSAILPRELDLSNSEASACIAHSGMSEEHDKIWTDGPQSELGFSLPLELNQDIAVKFNVMAFVRPNAVLRQQVQVCLNDSEIAEWSFEDEAPGRRTIVIKSSQISSKKNITLTFHIPTCAKPSSFGINNDNRALGIAFTRIAWDPIVDYEKFNATSRQYGRRVGLEARKSFDDKVDSGFWARFMTGPKVLDIGFKGYETGILPIVEGAVGVDLDYPGYDGYTLPFPSESQDAVYSSHCLEHIPHYIQAIQDWYRVTKVGGHIITVVPSALLYEKKRRPPSIWNHDHQRFYTPQSLLAEFEQSLAPNSYRVRHLAENDKNYDYEIPRDKHPGGCYEIELVVQKIRPPSWSLLD